MKRIVYWINLKLKNIILQRTANGLLTFTAVNVTRIQCKIESNNIT